MTTDELIEELKKHPGKEVMTWLSEMRCYISVDSIHIIRIETHGGRYKTGNQHPEGDEVIVL